MEYIWSGTDFPYFCLKDVVRTTRFRDAILSVVRQGDVVVDIGSGSGILAFFAAKAGARKVYAVEVDHLLVESLRKSISLNGLQDVVEVVEGDAAKANYPETPDVVIAEIIDTGLLDEMQVPVLLELHRRGIIDNHTRLIPGAYATHLTLVSTDNDYYGFQLVAPKHEWPFYCDSEAGWHVSKIIDVSNQVVISEVDFSNGEIDPMVNRDVRLCIGEGVTANGVKISGAAKLQEGDWIGATNSLNGNKILPIEPIVGPIDATFNVSYSMGQGLRSFCFRRVS